ncbi:MAG: AsmA family protein [Candidatus Omnitrophota bacterium]
MVKKILIGVLLFIIVIVTVVAIGKNIIAKTAVTTGVKLMTGLEMKIDSMDIGIVNTLLGIKGLKLYNPPDFEDKLMVDLPEIYVNYDLAAFLKKEVHLEEVRLNLKEFLVVRNKKGVLNLDSLTAVQAAKKETVPKQEKPKTAEKTEAPKIKIDLLKLKFGKVIEKDYSAGGEPVVKEYNINIDETFENITDPNEVVKIILRKVLPKLSAQLLKNSIAGGIEGTLKESKEMIKGLATDALGLGKDTADVSQEAVKQTADKIKKLFSF